MISIVIQALSASCISCRVFQEPVTLFNTIIFSIFFCDGRIFVYITCYIIQTVFFIILSTFIITLYVLFFKHQYSCFQRKLNLLVTSNVWISSVKLSDYPLRIIDHEDPNFSILLRKSIIAVQESRMSSIYWYIFYKHYLMLIIDNIYVFLICIFIVCMCSNIINTDVHNTHT